MASYVTTTDALVALNGTIPFDSVSIPFLFLVIKEMLFL